MEESSSLQLTTIIQTSLIIPPVKQIRVFGINIKLWLNKLGVILWIMSGTFKHFKECLCPEAKSKGWTISFAQLCMCPCRAIMKKYERKWTVHQTSCSFTTKFNCCKDNWAVLQLYSFNVLFLQDIETTVLTLPAYPCLVAHGKYFMCAVCSYTQFLWNLICSSISTMSSFSVWANAHTIILTHAA